MKIHPITCIGIVLLGVGSAQAEYSNKSTSFFDHALQADQVVQGTIDHVHCDIQKRLLCDAELQTAEKKIARIGWMPLYAGEPFPLLKQRAYYFLKKVETHPYASLWKKKSIVYYIVSDPRLSALDANDPWARFLSVWIKGLSSQRQETLDYSARFILNALLEQRRLPLQAALSFLEAHPQALHDPLPLDGLSALIHKLPLGTETQLMRFLNWAAAYLHHSNVQQAFIACALEQDSAIGVRLEAARLLEKEGHGLDPAFYETLLRSGDPKKIRPTLTALAAKQNAWSADMLYYAMRDLHSGDLQQVALSALVEMDRALALPRIETLLQDGTTPLLQFLGIQALGKFSAPSSVPSLIPYLESPEASISLAAEEALKNIGTAAALTAIENASSPAEHRKQQKDIELR